MFMANSIRKCVVLEYRCELSTTLAAERVCERLQEITDESFPWPWKTAAPFLGTIDADRFKISLRNLDPGVDLNGIVVTKPDGTRIIVTGRLGVARFIFYMVSVAVLAWILWQGVPAGDSRFIALWAVGTPCIAVLMRWFEIRVFREQWDESTECLKSEIGATIVSRNYD